MAIRTLTGNFQEGEGSASLNLAVNNRGRLFAGFILSIDNDKA